MAQKVKKTKIKHTRKPAAAKAKIQAAKLKDTVSGLDAEAPATEAQLQSARQYIYERFVQLYMHSSHARHSFAWLVLLKKSPPPPPVCTLAADSEEENLSGHGHWMHKPYPYSGFSRVLIVAIGIVCLSVLAQIMYPSGRTLPLSRLEGNGYSGLQTLAAIEHKINAINAAPVTVSTRSSSLETSYSAMGVRANAESTFNELSDYPMERRLIPFSIFFESLKPTKVSRDINVEKLMNFTKSVTTVTYKEPRDAKVTMQDNRLVVSPSEDGYSYDQTSLQKQVANTSLGNDPVVLEPDVIGAKITTQTAQTSVVDMQKRIDSGLTISAADQNLRLGSETIASWVKIEEKPDIQTINLSFDRTKVSESLKPIIAAVDLQGVPEEITLLNGVEAGRKKGKPGRTLQFEDLVNQVASATDWTVGLIQAKVDNEALQQNFVRSYSRDSTGFQSLINYWVSTHKGRYGIDLRSLNGRIEANTNGHQLFSGTHKLYIPHLAYGRISTRALNPGATTSTGFTVDGCIDKLVISGHDACAKALGDLIGWGDNNNMLAVQGFGDTQISPGGGMTSARDGAEWGIKLLDGGITTVAQRSALVSLMSQQTNRTGIPAGARGVAVADRAGQSGNVRYDVGIIYHPRGTYVLSVFTEGSSFASIADLAAEVNTVMGQ